MWRPQASASKAIAQAALGGALAELAQVGGGAVDAAEAIGRDVAADHQQVAAELLHDVELALGAGEGALALRPGMPSKSRNGCKVTIVEAELARSIRAHRPACR